MQILRPHTSSGHYASHSMEQNNQLKAGPELWLEKKSESINGSLSFSLSSCHIWSKLIARLNELTKNHRNQHFCFYEAIPWTYIVPRDIRFTLNRPTNVIILVEGKYFPQWLIYWKRKKNYGKRVLKMLVVYCIKYSRICRKNFYFCTRSVQALEPQMSSIIWKNNGKKKVTWRECCYLEEYLGFAWRPKPITWDMKDQLYTPYWKN